MTKSECGSIMAVNIINWSSKSLIETVTIHEFTVGSQSRFELVAREHHPYTDGKLQRRRNEQQIPAAGRHGGGVGAVDGPHRAARGGTPHPPAWRQRGRGVRGGDVAGKKDFSCPYLSSFLTCRCFENNVGLIHLFIIRNNIILIICFRVKGLLSAKHTFHVLCNLLVPILKFPGLWNIAR